MPGVDPGIDPVGEGLANYGVDYVGDVLARQLLQLSLHQGQGSQNIWILHGELHQMLDSQALELRNDYMLDVLGLEHLPIAIHQVLHVPNGHGFEAGKICPYIMGEKSVDLALAGELGTERLGGDIGELSLVVANLLVLLAPVEIVRHTKKELQFAIRNLAI